MMLGCVDTVARFADFLHDRMGDPHTLTIDTQLVAETSDGVTLTHPEWTISGRRWSALFGPGCVFGEGDKRYAVIGFDYSYATLWAD